MSPQRAGQWMAISYNTAGLLLGYLITAYLIGEEGKRLLWILDDELFISVLTGIAATYIMATMLGRASGKEIQQKKRDPILTGIKTSVLTLLAGILAGSTVGFVQEGSFMNEGLPDSINDYYLKPLYWILMIGLIPAIILGILFGKSLAKQISG